jgi:hypothetical protein
VTIQIQVTEGEHGVMVMPSIVGSPNCTPAEADAVDAIFRAIHASLGASGAVNVQRDEFPCPECGTRIRRPSLG